MIVMGLGEIFIIIFCACILFFFIYLLYVYYLKKCRSYKFKDGVPDVAILRPARIGSVGMKHFSAAPFRSSQLSISSSDRGESIQVPKRPHTFPLTGRPTASSNFSHLPEIRIQHV